MNENEIKAKIKELKKENTKMRKIINTKILHTNVRDQYIAQIEDNKIEIDDLLASLKTPSIVPVTGTDIIAHHKDTKQGSFGKSTVRF